MSALGPQGRAALRLAVTPVTPSIIRRSAPVHPKPSVHAAAAVVRHRLRAAGRLRALEADNAALRGDVAHLTRQLVAAREAGRRDEREKTARTMGGKVLSIFVGG